MIDLVISGAQIGADIAGLRAARACGIQTGGFMPSGRRTRNGALPVEEFLMYGLTETDSNQYPIRTEKNVVASDATIRFCFSWYSPGEKLTQRLLAKHGKPRFDVELRRDGEGKWAPLGFDRDMSVAFALTAAKWLSYQDVRVLNVAGNASEDIEGCVEWFLTVVFTRLRQMGGGEGGEDEA